MHALRFVSMGSRGVTTHKVNNAVLAALLSVQIWQLQFYHESISPERIHIIN